MITKQPQITFDKPLLPPLSSPGTITLALPIEEWLRVLKEPAENFVYHMEARFKSKTNPAVNAHLLLFLNKMSLNYSKGVNRFKDYYFQRVSVVENVGNPRFRC